MKQNIWKTVSLLRHLYGRLSIRNKIIGIYLLLILIPASVLMIYFCQRSAMLVERDFETSALQSLTQADADITFRFDNVQNISDILFVNTAMEDYLSRANEESPVTYVDDYDNIDQIRNLVQNIPESTEISVRVFAKDKTIFDSERDIIYPFSAIEQQSWYSKVLAKEGGIYWKSSYSEKFYGGNTGLVISCQRILRDPNNVDEIKGVFSIDLPEKVLYESISNINIVKKSDLMIVDEDGRIVSCYDKSKVGSAIPAAIKAIVLNTGKQSTTKIGADPNSSIVIVKKIALSGWYIVAQAPVGGITSKSSVLTSRTGIILIMMTLLIFMLAIFLIFASLLENMAKRVREVTGRIKEVGIESIDDSQITMQRDINRLEGSVNKMILTVRNLMQEAYQSKLNEQEARFKALQAQINPHFLYNTLDTIKWMQLCNQPEHSVDMLNSLSKYYRLSLNKGRDIVGVADELELANVYIKIQLARYQNNFEVKTFIDEAVGQYDMPKLTLQPIIENALVHGIQMREEKGGELTLTAKKQGEDILFIVTDDGVGMDEAQLTKVLTAGEQNDGSCYGLYNVNNRLKLFSGPEYGISITSCRGKGTVVTVKIKAINSRR
jgi:two-component system sensor histidine kinase YesM